jgi:hypothetical protein
MKMSSFDLTAVEVEFTVGHTEEESKITAFRHKRTGSDLNFGVVGTWLVDAEHLYDVDFPKEKGRYIMQAYWHDDKEYFDSTWDLVRL